MNEQEREEARYLSIAAPVLLPYLQRKQENAYNRLLGSYRNKGEANMGLVAECNAYTTIIDDIERRFKDLEHQANKENN